MRMMDESRSSSRRIDDAGSFNVVARLMSERVCPFCLARFGEFGDDGVVEVHVRLYPERQSP